MDGTMGDLVPQRDGGEGAELRGRRAFAGDGTLLGQVTDVLADSGGAARYVAVALEAPVARQQGGKRVFVPFRGARLDETGRVHLDEVTGASAATLPGEPTSGPLDADATVLDRARAADAEVALPAAASDVAATHGGEAARMVLSEEELRLQRRVVPAGEVVVHKEVVEETVRQTVPVMHEDVEVERRPVPPGAGLEPRTEGDVMYVPLVREEIVVTRRLVAHEELVIRKRQVTTEQVVEETVRREEARVERPGGGSQLP